MVIAKMNISDAFSFCFSCFDFYDLLFDEGLLSLSVLLSFEGLLRLLGCSLRDYPTLGESSLLLRAWSLFDLIRAGVPSGSLELLSSPDIILDLCFKTKNTFIY